MELRRLVSELYPKQQLFTSLSMVIEQRNHARVNVFCQQLEKINKTKVNNYKIFQLNIVTCKFWGELPSLISRKVLVLCFLTDCTQPVMRLVASICVEKLTNRVPAPAVRLCGTYWLPNITFPSTRRIEGCTFFRTYNRW